MANTADKSFKRYSIMANIEINADKIAQFVKEQILELVDVGYIIEDNDGDFLISKFEELTEE